MSKLVFVDCEAIGPAPCVGAVVVENGALTSNYFHAVITLESTESTMWKSFDLWLEQLDNGKRLVMVSDNPAFDFQWVNHGLWRYCNRSLLGHSARRISDYYAGLTGDFWNTQRWKRMRTTPHDHNALHDARGNAEAFLRIQAGERV